jgi:hypothetical protein
MVKKKKVAKKKAVKRGSSKRVAKDSVLKFGSAFGYCFHRAKGMWNILWLLFPIFGWFALGGYGVRIVKEFVDGKFEELPSFSFSSDMKLGFFMFLKAIPFMLAYLVVFGILGAISSGLGGFVEFFFGLFAAPILGVNFMRKETIESLFELNIVNSVFQNLGDYLLAILKSIGLALIFIAMIIVLVGLPASVFTKNIFIADFYRRRVK